MKNQKDKQRQQQILPRWVSAGDDGKTDNSNCKNKSEIQGFFAALRMTA
jgi:hypothetical protein